MKKGLTKANISGRAIKWLHTDGTESFTVTIMVGNAMLNEVDIETLNNLLEFVKEHPKEVVDFRKDDPWSDD
jgi:hypothetical protein